MRRIIVSTIFWNVNCLLTSAKNENLQRFWNFPVPPPQQLQPAELPFAIKILYLVTIQYETVVIASWILIYFFLTLHQPSFTYIYYSFYID